MNLGCGPNPHGFLSSEIRFESDEERYERAYREELKERDDFVANIQYESREEEEELLAA